MWRSTLPGNDITATDLYSLQLHCTVPNEGPAEEAGEARRSIQGIRKLVGQLKGLYRNVSRGLKTTCKF
jgi:hypothetical protein